MKRATRKIGEGSRHGHQVRRSLTIDPETDAQIIEFAQKQALKSYAEAARTLIEFGLEDALLGDER